MRLIGHGEPPMLSTGDAKVPYSIRRLTKTDAAYF